MGPASTCGTNQALARIFWGDAPSGASTTRIPPMSSPSTNSMTIVTPTVSPRARWPINQYPAPGISHPASATSGGGGRIGSAAGGGDGRAVVGGGGDDCGSDDIGRTMVVEKGEGTRDEGRGTRDEG